MIIGVDGTSIGSGGGINHLKNFIGFSSNKYKSNTYILFLNKKNNFNYNFGKNVKIKVLSSNILYNTYLIEKALIKNNCELLFSPAGFYLGTFKPRISMSQNMLPFNKLEIQRFNILKRWKFYFLKYLLKKSFLKSDGVIFLSNFAKRNILKQVQIKSHKVIPHGKESSKVIIKEDFPCRLKFLYVSDFWPYKNHMFLIDLLIEFLNYKDFQLDLVGFCPQIIKQEIDKKFGKNPNQRKKIKIHGSIPHSKTLKLYEKTDIVIFTSSCENLPIAIIEAMSFAKPIITLNEGPMNEMVFSNDLFLDTKDLNLSVKNLIKFCEPNNLKLCSTENFKNSNKYDWNKNVIATDKFFKSIINEKNI